MPCTGAAFNPGGVDRIDYVRDATEISNLTLLDGETCSAVGNARLRQVRDCAVECCLRHNSKLWRSWSEVGPGLVGRQTKKLEGWHRSDGDQNCCIPSVALSSLSKRDVVLSVRCNSMSEKTRYCKSAIECLAASFCFTPLSSYIKLRNLFSFLFGTFWHGGNNLKSVKMLNITK